MRDGVKLFTSVYIPKDRTQVYPILLERTPYSIEPYGIDNYPRELGPSDLLAKEGFVFAYQDVRGRYLSEGAFIEIPPHKPQLKGPTDTDESTDTYDTIDWLVRNVPDNNGRVAAPAGDRVRDYPPCTPARIVHRFQAIRPAYQ